MSTCVSPNVTGTKRRFSGWNHPRIPAVYGTCLSCGTEAGLGNVSTRPRFITGVGKCFGEAFCTFLISNSFFKTPKKFIC